MEPDNNKQIMPTIDAEYNYEQLVSLYWHPLRMYIMRRVGNLQDAEDIVQDAFLRAYSALERYTAQQRYTLKTRSWLYKIAWHVYCSHTSRSKQPPSISLEAAEESPLLEREDDTFAKPEAAFEQLENRLELEALVARLPQHYRNVVSLYYFAGLSHQEIADTLNQPPGTVKVYARRGVRLLRKALTVERQGVQTMVP